MRQIKAHEFRRMLRAVRGPDHNWVQEYARLTEIQNDSLKKAYKAFATPLLFYAILVSIGSPTSVAITLKEVTFSAPTGIVTFLASSSFIMVFLFLQSAFMVVFIRAKESPNFLQLGFTAGAVAMLHKIDDLNISMPITNWGFLRPFHPFSSLLTSLILLLVLLLLFPMFAVQIYLIKMQVTVLGTADNGFLNYIGAIFGLFAIGISLAYLLLFNVPLPYRKNIAFIRRGFLVPISNIFPHPRIKHWN